MTGRARIARAAVARAMASLSMIDRAAIRRRSAIQRRGQGNRVGPAQPAAQAARQRLRRRGDIGLGQASKQSYKRRAAGPRAPGQFLHHTTRVKNLRFYTWSGKRPLAASEMAITHKKCPPNVNCPLKVGSVSNFWRAVQTCRPRGSAFCRGRRAGGAEPGACRPPKAQQPIAALRQAHEQKANPMKKAKPNVSKGSALIDFCSGLPPRQAAQLSNNLDHRGLRALLSLVCDIRDALVFF